jgi:hypothetical protein
MNLFYSDASIGSMRNDDDIYRSNVENDDAENKSPNSPIAQLCPVTIRRFSVKAGHLTAVKYSNDAGQMQQ